MSIRVAAQGSYVHAPTWPTVAAAVCVGLSFLLAVTEELGGQSTNLEVSAAGYVLGSLATAVFIAVHRTLVQRAAGDIWYTPSARLEMAARSLLVAGLACGAWHAFVLATEIARR